MQDDVISDELVVEPNTLNVSIACIKLFLLVSLPIFSYLYLKKNNDRLDDEAFENSYGTLYQNLDRDRSSVYKMTSLFCIRRICIAISTIFLNKSVLFNFSINLVFSMYLMKYLCDNKPLNRKLMNRLELLNECFTFVLFYFMLLFTDFVSNVEIRYKIGYYFIYLVIAMISINLILVLIEMGLGIKLQMYIQYAKREWKKFREVEDKMLEFVI